MYLMEKLKDGAARLGLSLTASQLTQFETYYQELADWNQKINLTSITGYEEVQITHFLDSLTVIPGLPMRQPGKPLSVIDVGTGAGFPGIPLRIVLPEIRLTLLEATAKKAEFLRHITAKLELDDVEIVRGRAEEIAHDVLYREKFDVAVSRALAPLYVLTELTLPFCTIGGRLIAQKKGDISREIDKSSRAVNTLGGEKVEILGITLEEFGDARHLVIIDKVKTTTIKYPRRPGIPAKKPIL
jgi:16S rRNA (guanine527-N7)-methyltransferase